MRKHPKFRYNHKIVARGSCHGMLPVRPRCTHPPVGNPCSCGRCGEHAVPPHCSSLATTEFRMLLANTKVFSIIQPDASNPETADVFEIEEDNHYV